MLAKRPVTWLAVVFSLGIIAGDHSSITPDYYLLLAVIPLLIFLYLMLSGFRESRASSDSQSPLQPPKGTLFQGGRERILLALGILVIFAGAYHAKSERSRIYMVREHAPHFFDASLWVRSQPEKRGASSWRCVASLVEIDGAGARELPVVLSGNGAIDFERGDTLRGRVYKHKIKPPAYPGDFDFASYLDSRGYYLSLKFVRPKGATPSGGLYRVEPLPGFSFMRMIDRWRSYCTEKLLEAVPDIRGKLLAVTLLGYRVPEKDEDGRDFTGMRATFRSLGIGHVLAISGLHVGLVMGIVWLVASRIFSDRRQTALFCIAVCLLYLGMSGARVAAVRASVMALVYLGGFVLNRKSDFTNSLGLSALIILAVNPFALYDYGFLLSFTAVLFISRICGEFEWLKNMEFAAAGIDQKKKNAAGRGTLGRSFLRKLLGLVILSIAAWLAVWPISAYAFHQLQPVGLVINIIVLPLMSLVLGGGMIILIWSLLWLPLLGWAVGVFAFPAGFLIWFTRWVESLGLGALGISPPSGWLMLAYYLLFGLLFINRMIPGVRWRKICKLGTCVAIAFVLGAMLYDSSRSALSEPGMVFIPEKGGEAAVITTEGGRVVVVSRLPYEGRDVRDYLMSKGIYKVDLLVRRCLPGDKLLNNLFEGEVACGGYREVALKSGKDSDLPSRWESLGESLDAMMLCSYDKGGKLVCLGLKSGGASCLLTEWSWRGQIEYRLEDDGKVAGEDIVFLKVRGKDSEQSVAGKMNAGIVLLSHAPGDKDKSCFYRDDFGAVRVEKMAGGVLSVHAYDGNKWIRLPVKD
ncbi:MAG: ComEC/Rec2 family competence protein [Planctomycetes bacterium]|nr:ComEC/Rec2 family competence protein [Planctomycetota bacterium]